MRRSVYYIFILISAMFLMMVMGTSCQNNRQKLATHKKVKPQKITKKDRRKLTVKKQKTSKIAELFTSQEKQNKTACPDKNSTKDKEPGELQKSKGKFKDGDKDETASIRLGVEVINFDIVYMEENKLDIPSFKQFKNNMTDFTAHGEIEFRTIIDKITMYLGENTDGRGVTLQIYGSASQIPTSFDPSLPNNNIQADGSSIKGQTSIENNRKLAQARALELAKKIKAIFSNIEIDTPSLDEIQIGETPWTKEVQQRLDKAFLAGDKKAMEEVFAPFQKEQFVKVESQETFIKTIHPNSVRMYTLIAQPRIKVDGEEIKSRFVISKATYLTLSNGKTGFDNYETREKYFKRHGLTIRQKMVAGEQRWYLLHGHKEKHLLNYSDEYKRILESHHLKMVDKRDYDVLEQILTEIELREKRYTYVLK